MQTLPNPIFETAAEVTARLKREQELFAIDMRKFRDLMGRAYSILEQANSLYRVPVLESTQSLCAARLCAKLTRIVGEPDKADAQALIADLHYITNHVAEPILTAMAEYAKEHFHGVEADHFKNSLSDALSDISGEITNAVEDGR